MYENFYQFNHSPFRLSPDPSFFFGSDGHNRALSYLRYGLKQKEGFIVITGSPGTGKTTLSRALLQDIGREKIIVAELNTTHLEAEDVLRMVAGSFGLAFENVTKATLLKRLETFFVSRFRAGYHALLIVDESQNLPFDSIEELRMLSNFYVGKNALLQIFLLGQEQFRDKMHLPELEQLRQRVVASCHLEPLDQVETRDYIEHRLHVVGWQNDPQISDRAFVRIFSLTKGIPRRINTFCDRLFLFGSLEDIHQFKDEHVKSVANELMYEVSAKDVELSDIHPEAEDNKKSIVDPDKMDSAELANYSDDIPEKPAIEEIVQPLNPELASANDFSRSSDNENHLSLNDRQPFHVFSNSNTAVDSFESVPIAAIDESNVEVKSDGWRLIALAVDFYRFPDRPLDINSDTLVMGDGIIDLLKVAMGKNVIPVHMRVDELLGISDENLQSACIHFIKKILLNDEANYYRRLGVFSSASLDSIRIHYRYLFRLLQTEQDTEHSEQNESYIRRINQAFSTLRSAEKREKYDAFLAKLDDGNQQENTAYENPNTDEGVTRKIGNNETFRVPKLQADENKKSSKAWVGVMLFLFALGGGAFYYFQPNLTDLRSQLSSSFLNTNTIEKIERTKGSSTQILDEKIIEPEKTTNIEPIVFTPDVRPTEPDIEVEKFGLSKNLDATSVAKLKGPSVETNTRETVQEPKIDTIPSIISKSVAESVPAIAQVTKQKFRPKIPEKIVTIKPKKIEKVKTVIADKPPKVKVAKIVSTKPKLKSKPEKVQNSKPIPSKPKTKLSPKNSVVPAVNPPTEAVNTDFTITDPNSKLLDQKSEITDTELSELMTKFSLSYEEGELGRFMSLFSEDARSNNDEDLDNIRKDYKSLFDSTETRIIDLHGLNWVKKAENATGEGDFVVTVLRVGGDNTRKFTGRIKLEVIRIANKPLIKGIYHAYGEDEN